MKATNRKIRYAVVGLGRIAQVAVLPAFKHAQRNCKLVALVSDDPEKLKGLSKRYDVEHTFSYRQYGDFLRSGAIDAVYIALPNHLHEPRLFNSVFSMQVRPGNIRTDKEMGGGTLYDIGIYCINAARYLFRDEPVETFAFSSANKNDPRFKEIDEMTGAVLRFPKDRLATFATSFGAADVASYRIVGTRGDLRVENAYEYTMPVTHHLTVDGKIQQRTFRKRDQFAPELIYFSDCIKNDKTPEPSGAEGLADVRIIEGLYKSAKIRRPVKVKPVKRMQRPTMQQEIRRRAISKPSLIHVESAGSDRSVYGAHPQKIPPHKDDRPQC